ncbi:MAG: PLP-dependent aminotransferase family protein [Oceanospirillaceae bacterium]
MSQYLYTQLAQLLRHKIANGQLHVFSKLPSIRDMCRLHNVSKSTVLSAYAQLEAEGLIEARAKSGYYVTKPQNCLKKPDISKPDSAPRLISSTQVIVDMMRRGAAFDLLPNSKTDPYNEQLRHALTKTLRNQNSSEQLYYDQPQGNSFLRTQLAYCINHGAGQVSEDDVIITNGCQHSLLLALMATTEPNDVVAIESPGFYGALQLLEALGRKVLEIPSSSDQGISLDALKLASNHWDIKALIVSPSFATPTGSCMSEAQKEQLLGLAERQNFVIIEDDIYAELHYDMQRPRTIYSYDTKGFVILCSSLSKILSRDLRIGWILSSRYHQQILALKIATSMSNSVSQQQGVALFIANGGLDKHLKLRRAQLKKQKEQLQALIINQLPMAKSASQPKGGMVVWLELDSQINTLTLYHQAREIGLTITPGSLFSAQDTYQHYLRLSFAHPWTDARQQAFKQLAKLVHQY